jgi:hypothetical protein
MAPPSSAYTRPRKRTAIPAIIHDKLPAGPAIDATRLPAKSHPEPNIAPNPINTRSPKDKFFLNFPFSDISASLTK